MRKCGPLAPAPRPHLLIGRFTGQREGEFIFSPIQLGLILGLRAADTRYGEVWSAGPRAAPPFIDRQIRELA